MKSLSKSFALLLVLAFVFVGCGKEPTADIDAAKAAIDAVVAAGGNVYAKDELAKLNEDFQAAQTEITAQADKTFKNYAKATELLVKVKTDAEALQAAIPAKMEEAKNGALAAQAEAQAAIAAAKEVMAKAAKTPGVKAVKAEMDAVSAELKDLEGAYAQIQTALDSSDFMGAKDTAVSLKDKATSITDRINMAIEKVKAPGMK